MFEKTSAIIIHCQKYSDKAVILHTYTRHGGRTNFMVYGGTKKGSIRGLIETPLAIVELEYENKPGQDIYTLHSISPIYLPKDAKSEQQLTHMLMSEVIYKTLRQPMEDERVYQFLAESIRNEEMIDVQEWMMRLSALLGYGGEWLEEWKNLNSLQMIEEMLG